MRHRSVASRAHALSRALDRELASTRARDLGWELERDLARALDRADALARALDHEDGAGRDLSVLAEDLIRALAQARNLACSRARARNLIRTLDRARSRARNLRRSHTGLCRDQAGLGSGYTGPGCRGTPAGAPPCGTAPAAGRVPQGVVAMAVRVLPAPDRDRYGDEFRAEMHELRTRWHQLAYALRVLSSAPALRRALIERMPPLTSTSEQPATQRGAP